MLLLAMMLDDMGSIHEPNGLVPALSQTPGLGYV